MDAPHVQKCVRIGIVGKWETPARQGHPGAGSLPVVKVSGSHIARRLMHQPRQPMALKNLATFLISGRA
jgi:hypothetical protein